MQAQGSSTAIAGLRGNYMKVAEQQAKPTKQERAAARNELDRYNPMNWDNSQDSRAELNDPALWVSDTSNQTQLQEDIEMLREAKRTLAQTASGAH